MNLQLVLQTHLTELCQQNLANFPYIKDYLLTPGKLIRPTLYLDFISSRSFSRDGLQKNDYHIASALEILHLFFLVHDDIMDGDSLRRDQVTIHAHYAKEFGETKAQGLGIVVGDLLFSRSLRIFTENLNKPAALKILFEVIDTTAKGQVDEYLLTPSNLQDQKFSTAKILHYYEEKTALYSIYLPLVLGYFQSSNRVDKQEMANLLQFSKHLGVAFQINDDLIEFNLQKKRNQENLCSDVMRGKITPILSMILEKSNKKYSQKWVSEWRRGELSRMSHDQILKAGHEVGALFNAHQLIQENLKKAEKLGKELDIISLPTIQKLFQSLK